MICDDHDLLIGLFERNPNIGAGEVLAAYKRCAAELVAMKIERDNLIDRLDTAQERIRDLVVAMAAARASFCKSVTCIQDAEEGLMDERDRLADLIAMDTPDDTEVEAPQ